MPTGMSYEPCSAIPPFSVEIKVDVQLDSVGTPGPYIVGVDCQSFYTGQIKEQWSTPLYPGQSQSGITFNFDNVIPNTIFSLAALAAPYPENENGCCKQAYGEISAWVDCCVDP